MCSATETNSCLAVQLLLLLIGVYCTKPSIGGDSTGEVGVDAEGVAGAANVASHNGVAALLLFNCLTANERPSFDSCNSGYASQLRDEALPIVDCMTLPLWFSRQALDVPS